MKCHPTFDKHQVMITQEYEEDLNIEGTRTYIIDMKQHKIKRRVKRKQKGENLE